MSVIALPVGSLHVSEDGFLTVRLPFKGPERAQVRAWLDRLAVGVSNWVFAPRRATDRPFGTELEYSEETRKSESLLARTAEWGQDVRAAVPQILALARFALGVAEEFAAGRGKDAPVGPAFVRFVPGGSPMWRLVAVPIGEAELGDWAGADPAAWLWASAQALLGPFANDGVHALGAALHHGFVGALFPETLSRREQFTRLLHDRVGAPGRLTAAINQSLPTACSGDAATLSTLVLDCLHPRAEKRPSLAEAKSRFGELERRLAIDAHVGHWQREYRHDVVDKLFQKVKPPEPTAPPQGLTWSDIARQRLSQQDYAEALDAAWSAVVLDGPGYFRLYLGILQCLAARLPRPLAQVQAALDRLMQQFGSQLDEGDFLRIVHLKLRHLGTPESEVGRLDRPYASRWNEGTAFLLRAWLQLRKAQSFNLVSRWCREGIKRFQTMPESGGSAGSYACSYLHLLDGIAHVLYVGANGPADYYADALDCFTQSFTLATRSEAEDLLRSCCRWLAWLSGLTSPKSTTLLRQVHLGARALLQSQGVLADNAEALGVPDIPSYDETILFPL
jgi:hypothetical protein